MVKLNQPSSTAAGWKFTTEGGDRVSIKSVLLALAFIVVGAVIGIENLHHFVVVAADAAKVLANMVQSIAKV